MSAGRMAQVQGGWEIFDKGEGCAMLIGVTFVSCIFGIVPGIVLGISTIPSACAIDIAM